MRVLHVTAFHSSLSAGGTEFYIEGLKSALQKVFQAENFVAVFSSCRPADGYWDANVTFFSPTDLSTGGLLEFQKECQDFLDRLGPDFVIFHTVDNYEGIFAAVLSERKIPYGFILHASSWLCYQRDRLFNCQEECKRMFAPFRCSICGWRRKGNLFLNGLKSVAGEGMRLLHLRKTSRYWEIKKELALKEMVVRGAAAVIALNQRDYDCLLQNGIERERIHLMGTALSEEVLDICRKNARQERDGVLKILCAGRFCDVKGSNILVEAAHSLPADCRFQLDCYGVVNETDEYVLRGRRLAEGDSRIRILPMLPHEELLRKYAEYDIQCLPSTVFDNGPLALWEGAYSGCRIATSENVGQKAFVAQYGDVIAPNTVEAWREYLKRQMEQRDALRAARRTEFPEYNSMDGIARRFVSFLFGKQPEAGCTAMCFQDRGKEE